MVRQAVSKIAAFEANEVGSIPARAGSIGQEPLRGILYFLLILDIADVQTVSIDVTRQTVASIAL